MGKKLAHRLYLVSEVTGETHLCTPEPGTQGSRRIELDIHELRLVAYELLAHAERMAKENSN